MSLIFKIIYYFYFIIFMFIFIINIIIVIYLKIYNLFNYCMFENINNEVTKIYNTK